MRSTFGGLNTLVRGLYANQISLDTVGHNIANMDTDGFSRQRVNLSTTVPQTVYGSKGSFQLGSGVDIQSVTRIRDGFIDRQMWQETTSLGYGTMKHNMLTQVEGVFREPTETGIQTVLNKFWTSLQTLSTNASNESVRTAVRQRGVELCDAIGHSAQQLKDMTTDMNSVLKIKVDRVNQITSEISSLNRQITTIEVGNLDHANDLRDRRDLLMDELSSLMKVQVREDKDGNYNISSGNMTLVNGTNHITLDTVPDLNSRTLTYYGVEVNKIVDKSTGKDVQVSGGEIGGLLDARDSDEFGVLAYLDHLDKISKFLLTDFNDVHRAGYGLNDSTGNNFFGDPATNYSGNPGGTEWEPAGYSGGWISQVKVNKDLFDPADGLQKIAAKTLPGQVDVTKNGHAGGDLTVDGSYVGPGGHTYMVRVDSVDSGKVLTASYSLDGGATWTAAAPDTTTDPVSFKLANGVIISIKTDSINNHADNRYTFQPPQGNASGDNAVLLGNRLKTDKRPMLGDATLDTYYSALIGGLGVQTQNAERLVENQKVLVLQIDNWRQSVAGVNMDEEMSNMIRFQKGYAAAARVVSAMDEMLDKLINGTGVVGR